MKTAHKVGGGALVIACAFIAPWEGLWTTAKVDNIGTGRPITWCYGETKGGAKVGDKFTPQQCSAMLAKRLPEYNDEISKCIHVPLSDKTRAAFISFAYNVGPGAVCKGNIGKRLKVDDVKGACDALLAYNHAQGRVVKGLTNRRNAERALCLEGLNEKPAKPALSLWQKIKLFFISIFTS